MRSPNRTFPFRATRPLPAAASKRAAANRPVQTGDNSGQTASFDELLKAAGVAIKCQELPGNTTIFRQGAPAREIFYLRNGLVKCSVLSRDGKEAVVKILGPGEFFGTCCLAGEPARDSTAATLTRATVHAIRLQEMRRALRTQPALTERMIPALVARNVASQRDLVNLLLNPAEKRLAHALLQLARYGRPAAAGIVLPRVSQQVLADMIGSTRTRVNYFIGKFRRLGLVKFEGSLHSDRSSPRIVILR